jgi:type IV pilus assembly protein PilE
MTSISRHKAGFTLIELMVVVAIIGILTAIAYPSYIAYVQRSHRAQLKTIMQENAQILQRFFTAANAYDVDANGNAPPVFDRSPKPNEGNLAYQIVINNPTSTSYVMTATPVGGGPMAGDACGSFTLNQLGQKGLSGNALTIADCWGR